MTDPIPTPRGSSLAYPEMNELFVRNKAWSDKMWEKDPGFFPRHFPGQRPEILWIGCADARVPETTIMGCGPGEIFTVRNIANTYSPHDDSTNGVLAIALQNFKVKHVVITGHSQCVGCQQALNVSRLPSVPATTSLQRYLKPIAALASTLTTEDGPCTLDKLVEENVVQQVTNLLVSDIIAQDWKRRGPEGVVVHGWVYHLEDGTIRDLNISQGPPGHVPGKKVNGFF